MKTMGVIGGISPQATMYFEQRVHAISQRLIPQLVNSGYPPMVVYFHRTAPFILGADYRPVMPLQPHPELLAAAQKLGTWADFLVITANAPHLMQDLIEQASGLKVLSIIALTLDDMKRRNWQKVACWDWGSQRFI